MTGARLPALSMAASDGGRVVLGALPGRVVIYAYPMTARPDRTPPDGWDMIPGAKGCTPQSCAFRDHAAELAALGVDQVFGLSTQTRAYQAEAAARLHLPFALLSDAELALTRAMQLPVLEVEGMTLLRRMAWVVRDGAIEKVFYPVFPPSENAAEVIAWLKGR